jgi:hypothetical protein
MTELPEKKAFRAPYTFQPSAIPAKKFCKIVFTLSVGAGPYAPMSSQGFKIASDDNAHV